MAVYISLFILSVMGISETVYLIKKRKKQETPVCFFGEDCRKVLESRYNKTFGAYNDVLGLLFYITVLIISAFLMAEVKTQELWTVLIKVVIFSGVLASSYFTYIQWKVIKEWCFWCLISVATTLLMAVFILFI